MNIAIQGVEGSFHHQAAKNYFNTAIAISASETFRGVFEMVEKSKADYGVVAIENSLYGSIAGVLDLLEAHAGNLAVIGETYLHVRQQLIGLPGTRLNEIKTIYSHPVALAQCEVFFDTTLPAAQRVEYHDTAAAVDFVKQQNDPSKVAVAGTIAADHYGLRVLVPNIEDNKANYTRFLIIARRRPQTATLPNKLSLVLTTNHAPGALSHVLAIFASENANLTKLESRPIIGSPWQYKFYIDIETTPEIIERCLSTVRETGTNVTELGRYTAAQL